MRNSLNILFLLVTLASVITFYVFVLPIPGLELYPLIGSFIASHGSFIAMLIYIKKGYK